MRWFILFLVAAGYGSFCVCAEARVWTSATGGYQLEADAVAFNESTVILKKGSGDLIAVQLAELTVPDREYVRSKELSDVLSGSLSEIQTWTSVDGMKVRGRVLAYGRKDLSVSRQRGKVVINEIPFAKIEPLHQRLVLKIMSHLEFRLFEGESQLTTWAKNLGGNPKVYPLEGVLMELESGDQIAVPFFLFREQERNGSNQVGRLG